MSNAILAITDGTLRYSLITRPWWLEDWIPQNPPLKGGGIRRGSPLSDGTRLVDFSYANTIDTYMLKVMHGEQDGAIRNLQDMKRLLEKGRRYWTDDWATEPVWIEARGSDETNIRYAVIKNWSLPQGSNPYAQPFFPQQQEAVMEGLALTLEHGFWQAYRPGTVEGIEIATQQVYNAVTYGRAAASTLSGTTPADEHYVVSKHNLANVTHVFTWTSPAGPFGGNLIGAGLPFDILNGGAVGPANGDITYFGCNTALADSGPFVSLVFDVLTAATYGAGDSTAWEYWNGAWVALTVMDVTGFPITGGAASWAATGVASIAWQAPSDWATVAVNAITGYWVRAVVTEATAVTRAQQQNRDIYSCVWPRVDVDELQVLGDIPAALRIQVHGQSDLGADFIRGSINRVFLALRSLSRGSDFSPYLNLAQEQNPTGTGAKVNGAGNTTFTVDPRGPTGWAAVYDVAGVTAVTYEFNVAIGSAVSQQWIGEYHAFLRYRTTAGAADEVRLQTRAFSSGSVITSPWFNLAGDNDWNILDLGRMTLPIYPLSLGTDLAGTGIDFWIETTAAGAHTVSFYDFILMPVDEWFGVFEQNIDANVLADSDINISNAFDLDGIQRPKAATTYLRDDSSGVIRERYVSYTAAKPIWQANADQRMWFFFHQSIPGTNVVRWAPPQLLATIRAYAMERYQSMRGAR